MYNNYIFVVITLACRKVTRENYTQTKNSNNIITYVVLLSMT